MRLTPEELSTEQYVLLEKLDHQELIPFVQKYLKQPTWASRFYYAVNLLILAAIALLVWRYGTQPGAKWWNALNYLAMGIAFTFLLIPVHEYIHALAYRSVGATHTSFDMYLRKFYFMAVADKFVASRKEFTIVALAPFVVISVGLLGLLIVATPLQVFIIMGALFFHTAACSGDFGLLSFYNHNRQKNIFTYDDKTSRISYFYEKVN